MTFWNHNSLRSAGMQVDAWSRHATSTMQLVAAGATAYDTAFDAVKRADLVITMLPTGEITTQVMIGSRVLGAMPPSQFRCRWRPSAPNRPSGWPPRDADPAT